MGNKMGCTLKSKGIISLPKCSPRNYFIFMTANANASKKHCLQNDKRPQSPVTAVMHNFLVL